MARAKRLANKAVKALDSSPINYLSDLFVIVMVVGWAIVLFAEIIFASYGTVVLSDLTGWSYVTDCATSPLVAGGAIWMIKNSVQHAIANSRGEQAHMDFPPVPDTEIEHEREATFTTEDTYG